MDLHLSKKIYGCSLCRRRFRTFPSLRKHMRFHAKERKFTCSVCHQWFASEILLKDHSKIHKSALPFRCLFCDARYSLKLDFTSHVKTCTVGHGLLKARKEKNLLIKECEQRDKNSMFKEFCFSCGFCRQSFREKVDLKSHHLATHCGKKRFPCPFCVEEFPDKTQLKYHFSVHQLKSNFSCKFCSGFFSTKDLLDKHLLVHTGKQIYGTRFANKFDCSGCYTCRVCHLIFTSAVAYLQHQVKHPRLSLKCDIPFSPFEDVVSKFLPVDEIPKQKHNSTNEIVLPVVVNSESDSSIVVTNIHKLQQSPEKQVLSIISAECRSDSEDLGPSESLPKIKKSDDQDTEPSSCNLLLEYTDGNDVIKVLDASEGNDELLNKSVGEKEILKSEENKDSVERALSSPSKKEQLQCTLNMKSLTSASSLTSHRLETSSESSHGDNSLKNICSKDTHPCEVYSCILCTEKSHTADNFFKHIMEHNKIKWKFSEAYTLVSSFDEVTDQFRCNAASLSPSSDILNEFRASLESMEISISFDEQHRDTTIQMECNDDDDELPDLIKGLEPVNRVGAYSLHNGETKERRTNGICKYNSSGNDTLQVSGESCVGKGQPPKNISSKYSGKVPRAASLDASHGIYLSDFYGKSTIDHGMLPDIDEGASQKRRVSAYSLHNKKTNDGVTPGSGFCKYNSSLGKKRKISRGTFVDKGRQPKKASGRFSGKVPQTTSLGKGHGINLNDGRSKINSSRSRSKKRKIAKVTGTDKGRQPKKISGRFSGKVLQITSLDKGHDINQSGGPCQINSPSSKRRKISKDISVEKGLLPKKVSVRIFGGEVPQVITRRQFLKKLKVRFSAPVYHYPTGICEGLTYDPVKHSKNMQMFSNAAKGKSSEFSYSGSHNDKTSPEGSDKSLERCHGVADQSAILPDASDESLERCHGDADQPILGDADKDDSASLDPTNDGKIHACGSCYRLFESVSQINLHYKIFHNDKEVFQCPQCTTRFDRKSLLEKHEQRHRDIDCQKPFISKNSLQNRQPHLEKVVSSNVPHETKVIKDAIDPKLQAECHPKAVQAPKKLRSLKVSKTATEKRIFMQNRRKHSLMNSMKCSMCQKSFPSKLAFRIHYISHIKRLILKRISKANKVCLYPNKSLIMKRDRSSTKKNKSQSAGNTQDNNHEKRISSRSKEKSYVCFLCDKICHSKDFLTAHMDLIHGCIVINVKEASTFPCMACNSHLSTAEEFFRHISAHNRIKWSCDLLRKESCFNQVVDEFLPDSKVTGIQNDEEKRTESEVVMNGPKKNAENGKADDLCDNKGESNGSRSVSAEAEDSCKNNIIDDEVLITDFESDISVSDEFLGFDQSNCINVCDEPLGLSVKVEGISADCNESVVAELTQVSDEVDEICEVSSNSSCEESDIVCDLPYRATRSDNSGVRNKTKISFLEVNRHSENDKERITSDRLCSASETGPLVSSVYKTVRDNSNDLCAISPKKKFNPSIGMPCSENINHLLQMLPVDQRYKKEDNDIVEAERYELSVIQDWMKL